MGELVTWVWAAEGVALVTLENGPVNLLSRAALADLEAALADLEAEADLRAVIVTGAGERAFSAGADIKEFPALRAEASVGGGAARPGQRALDRLAALPVPTVAAIDGLALGGGLELALACDLRIAGEQARLGLPETGLGIFPCYGGTQRLPRLVGPAVAKELIYTGRIVEADEAQRLGIVNRVVADGEAVESALALADALASRPPLALRAAKLAIDAGLDSSLAGGQEREAALADPIFASADAGEGVAAFIEKRAARFVGR